MHLPHKYLLSQGFVGMQLIDSKAMVVGNVKDVSVNFEERNLAFRISATSRKEMDIPWEDMQSVEDMVLLED